MSKEVKKVEPIVLDCGKAIEGESFKGDTFELVKTNKGILYHVYGGYSIFVTPNNVSLYETFNDLIVNRDEYSKAVGEERETLELNISAMAHVLNIPLIAFSNADFTFEMASKTIQFLQKVYDESVKQELQEETVEEDAQFKEATLAVEHVQKEMSEEIEHLS